MQVDPCIKQHQIAQPLTFQEREALAFVKQQVAKMRRSQRGFVRRSCYGLCDY